LPYLIYLLFGELLRQLFHSRKPGLVVARGRPGGELKGYRPVVGLASILIEVLLKVRRLGLRDMLFHQQ